MPECSSSPRTSGASSTRPTSPASCSRAPTGANVFVEIFADRIEVSNPGGLPSGMVPADLGHKSVRRNPLIADLLHRIEYIEKAGTGILRMREAVRKHGSPAPVFESTGFFSAIFRPIARPIPEVPRVIGEAMGKAATREATGEVTGEATGEATGEVTGEVASLLSVMDGAMKRREIQEALGLKHEDHFREAYLLPSLKLGFIAMTVPDKPRSPNQRYRITSLGLAALQKGTP